MQFDEFKKKLIQAKDVFLKEEKSLFDTYGDKLREEAISHQFACRLARIFSDYNVDCEYSRQPNGNQKQNDDGKVIRPDIIIHKRGNNDDNLALIEVKWDKNPDRDDQKIQKIKNLNYKFAVVIRFKKDGTLETLDIKND